MLTPIGIYKYHEMLSEMLKPSVDLVDGVTVQDFLNECISGAMQLWVAHIGQDPVAFVVTAVNERMRHCQIIQCAGERLDEWKHLIGVIEDWARSVGCTHVEIQGRKGWGRVFPDYKHAYVVYEKEL